MYEREAQRHGADNRTRWVDTSTQRCTARGRLCVPRCVHEAKNLTMVSETGSSSVFIMLCGVRSADDMPVDGRKNRKEACTGWEYTAA